MAAKRLKRAPDRRRRQMWVNDSTWDTADELAANEAITVGHVLTALLTSYGTHTLNVPVPKEEVRTAGRGQHPTTIADRAWDKADQRRRTEGIQSMSVLCELLLKDYTAGRVGVGITVTPTTTRGDNPEGSDRDGPASPVPLAA